MPRRERLPDVSTSKLAHQSAARNIGRQTPIRNDERTNIAQAAARLIAEGLTDYQAAKQKAARQFGATDRGALPTNHEIETALREHLALFADERQPQVLATLRETALRVMSRLEQFSPWLVGAVLNGTANEFSEIELELVGVESKDFELHLLNAGVAFELSESHGAGRISSTQKSPALKYRVEFCGVPVTVTLFDHQAARQATYPANSIKRDRAQREEAEKRFASAAKL